MGTDRLIIEDALQIRETLSDASAYSFSADLQSRMDSSALSSVQLADRCFVSHTIVDKWKKSEAKPNGKERMKELGMALGMDENALDTFLYRNGYPKLYAKNPLDSAAKLLLMHNAGRPDIVEMYRVIVERLGLKSYTPQGAGEALKTQLLSAELREAARNGQVSRWFCAHRRDFAGNDKTQLADMRIACFILLYLGDATVHEMALTGELPPSLKKLLYPLLAGRAVNVRGLREKLTAFGFYVNMTEDELDTLLLYARLRPFSDTQTRLDQALLSALRIAHERYPHYEYDNLERIVKRLKVSTDEYELSLLAEYEARRAVAAQLTAYYDGRPRTPEEERFEELYTSYSDRGIMDYARDILSALTDQGTLSRAETGAMTELLTRTQEGASIWN